MPLQASPQIRTDTDTDTDTGTDTDTDTDTDHVALLRSVVNFAYTSSNLRPHTLVVTYGLISRY